MAFGTAAKKAGDRPSTQELTVQVDAGMTRVAVAALLLGVFWILVLDWVVAGWAALILSPLFLWLAHQFAIAPCLDETAYPAKELDA